MFIIAFTRLFVKCAAPGCAALFSAFTEKGRAKTPALPFNY